MQLIPFDPLMSSTKFLRKGTPTRKRFRFEYDLIIITLFVTIFYQGIQTLERVEK